MVFSAVITRPRTHFHCGGSLPVRQSAAHHQKRRVSAGYFSMLALVLFAQGGADSREVPRASIWFQHRLAASPVPDAPPAPTRCELHRQKQNNRRGERPASSVTHFQTRFKLAFHAGSGQRYNVSASSRTFRSAQAASPAQSRGQNLRRPPSFRRPPHQS
ncbi:hypothetical protein KCP74_25195 [Salmonella enterica subsp. enterica]|nr:hypothetical protein KCP74_25195 [Salmonella enterica subsp. enterica]